MDANKAIEALKPVVEEIAKKYESLLDSKLDQVIDLVAAKVCALIPGGVDDAFMAMEKPKIKEQVHALLHSEIEKIS